MHSALISAKEYTFFSPRKKIHARAISFRLTTVLWARCEEKDIRWTAKIIGTDSLSGSFSSRAPLENAAPRPIVHAQCAVACRLSEFEYAREEPTDRLLYARPFPAVRLHRYSIFECHGRWTISESRPDERVHATIKHDRDRHGRDRARISNENFRTEEPPRFSYLSLNNCRYFWREREKREQCAIQRFSKPAPASAYVSDSRARRSGERMVLAWIQRTLTTVDLAAFHAAHSVDIFRDPHWIFKYL